ncbi:hemicentin-2-like [Tachysurus vachellii]|uniref:hemicentin-2-like n=1 Tax=Tachysurus vachellii TaxID=175792 RepID=UPI00296AC0B9|nr:hemicentin-2-like [Tachysurus vachellii]
MLEHTSLRDLFRILLPLLCFFHQMPGAENYIQIDPSSLVVRFGSPASANCSTNVTHNNMGWEASQGSIDKTFNVTLITWSVEQLDKWDIKPLCFINGEEQDMKSLTVTVYKPLDQVTLSTENHTMTEGSQYNLICEVLNVAPVYLLTVSWYKGGVLIKQENFSHENETKNPVNKTVTLQISPNRTDDGVQYSCEAELKLGPEGPQPPPKMKSDFLNITVHYGPEFSNCPGVVDLKEGTSLTGICDVTGNPFPHSTWKKDGSTIDPANPLKRTSAGMYEIIVRNIQKSLMVNVIYGPELSCGHSYTVREGNEFNPNCSVVGYPSYNMSWDKNGAVDFPLRMQKGDAGQYTLIVSNNVNFILHAVEINVLYQPSSISELHSANVSIGEDVVLKCASNGKPRPRYKWIYHHASNVQITDQDGVSLLHIKHAGGANIGTYLCIAYNDLGKQRQEVRVHVEGAEQECPLSLSSHHVLVEYGETVNVKCLSSVSNATLKWRFRDTEVNNDTLVIDSALDYLDWNLNATCYGNFVGLGGCSKDLNITIYKHPEKVSISIKNHSGPMIEGNSYMLQCDVQNTGPLELLTVNWNKVKGQTGNEDFIKPRILANESTTLTISPSRNDTSYSCSAELRLGEKNSHIIRSNPLYIEVHYKPTIWKNIPGVVPVFYGYSEKLYCNASGNPKPTITWFYKNKQTSGENLTVNEQGVYTCVADNSVGNDTKVISVVIEDARCELVLSPPELLVEYGASASVDCSTATPSTHFSMGWKVPQGVVHVMKDVQLITWKVETLMHWDIQPICFLNPLSTQCFVKLPVTVYKLPDRVSISIVGHEGPMIEGKQYELQCDVYNFAPVHLLTVNWYKGQHLVAKTSFSDSTKTPVNQSTRFHMSLNRDDDGVRYWCEAELKLSRTRAGAQTPFEVASQVLGLTVHYSPQVSSGVEIFNETTEDIVLNCTVTANPPPRYTWNSTNLGKEFNIGHPVLVLSSLSSGNYTCTASNGIGSVSKLFIVQAKPRGGNRTTFWAIVGPFVGLAVVMIVGYVLVKKRTIKK